MEEVWALLWELIGETILEAVWRGIAGVLRPLARLRERLRRPVPPEPARQNLTLTDTGHRNRLRMPVKHGRPIGLK